MYAHAKDSGKYDFVGVALSVLGVEKSLEMDRPKPQNSMPNKVWIVLVLGLFLTMMIWRASGLPYRPLMTLYVVLFVSELFRRLLMRAPRD